MKKHLKRIPEVVQLLEKKVGHKNAVTADYIAIWLDLNDAKRLKTSKIRDIIHHIRVQGLVKNLVANTQVGYYVEPDPKKVSQYVNELEGRIASIQEVIDSFKN